MRGGGSEGDGGVVGGTHTDPTTFADNSSVPLRFLYSTSHASKPLGDATTSTG
jgi:hypothetical protein